MKVLSGAGAIIGLGICALLKHLTIRSTKIFWNRSPNMCTMKHFHHQKWYSDSDDDSDYDCSLFGKDLTLTSRPGKLNNLP